MLLSIYSYRPINFIIYRLKLVSNLLLVESSLNKFTGFLFNIKISSCYFITTSIRKLFKNFLWGIFVPFVKIFILRGIGYQASVIENNFIKKNYFSFDLLDFPYTRYLLLRVGHSFCLYVPVPLYIGIKVKYKDRKIIIYGPYKNHIFNFSSYIFKYRRPSVYTGRGIRAKGYIHVRKLGKKDIRKGRI